MKSYKTVIERNIECYNKSTPVCVDKLRTWILYLRWYV